MEHAEPTAAGSVHLPHGVTIRPYQAGDEVSVARIYRVCELVSVPDREVIDDIRGSLEIQRRILVAERGGEVVGTITARDASVEPLRSELLLLAVDPSARGERLGEALTRALLRRESELGVRVVDLVTYEDRRSAIRIYLDCGFRPVFHHAGDPARWRRVAHQVGRDPGHYIARREADWSALERAQAELVALARAALRSARKVLRPR